MTHLIRPLYLGPAEPISEEDRKAWLDSPPPWRDHRDVQAVSRSIPSSEHASRKGRTYVPTGQEELDAVNLALWLRRPLLVTGPPGIGKSSLAYGVAAALGLGAPLRWEIHSQTTLQDGLYSYDAVGHFRAARTEGVGEASPADFIELGPLGTAFVPGEIPRVLLIDELDKASWDLPNNLLHIFEEAEFRIPELYEHAGEARVKLVDSQSGEDRVAVDHARVRARHHPVVVITSNDEREFSPAFMRRCVPLKMSPLTPDVLKRVVESQFGDTQLDELSAKLERLGDDIETDIALQAIFAATVCGDLARIRDLLRRD